MKVIDKIKSAEAENKTIFSFEFFPPKTDNGVHNLFEKMQRMAFHSPSFCDITWGAGGSTADLTLDIAKRMQNTVGVETMMHLTCTNMPVQKLDHALDTIKSNGLKNVLALRGDPPHGEDKFVQVQGGFACALDLVNHIRSKYGDYFGITVAGYPEAHPDVIEANGLATPEAYASDLSYLKRKVDAGADLIVTQLFYDTDVFLKFVNDCRQIGITCPIVPGIMPINNYKGFIRMTGFCKTKIPQEITDALEPIKDNEDAVRNYGIHLGTEMCKKILASGIKQLHLYTLNMEKSALGILLNLGLIEETQIQRPLTANVNLENGHATSGVLSNHQDARKKTTVIFVLGGPGSGKGTQCTNIVEHFGYTHLSAGDLLRAEIKSGSENGTMIQNMIKEGKIVPAEVTIKLLQKAIEESGKEKFLIDGFPRNEENRASFESITGIVPEIVLFFDCSEEEMEKRLLSRNQGREDDNIETIRKRFKVYMESSLPVIQYYDSLGKVRRVDAGKPINDVFEDVKAIFEKVAA